MDASETTRQISTEAQNWQVRNNVPGQATHCMTDHSKGPTTNGTKEAHCFWPVYCFPKTLDIFEMLICLKT